MAANKDISQRNGLLSPPEKTYTVASEGTTFSAPQNLAAIVDFPRLGEYQRQVIAWRTPHLGVIKMYINPQNLSIVDGKDISTARTKSGFVIQYAGEKFTDISVSGTTGSGGIEGINILEQIYRSEQEGFGTIAQSLERQLTNAQLLGLFKGPNSSGVTNLGDAFSQFVEQTASEAALNIFDQPFPTLASLAANVEMIYQNVTYRGFFRSMRVDEKATEPGLFEYSLQFTAYAKQGIRRNFMPWHRQPFNPANIDANPLSFSGPIERQIGLTEPSQPIPERGPRVPVASVSLPIQNGKRRDTNNGLGTRGQSLLDLNLEDVEV